MLYSFEITVLNSQFETIHESIHGTLTLNSACWTRPISIVMNRLIGPDSRFCLTEWFLVNICLNTISLRFIFSSPIRINYRCNILLNWVCHLTQIDLDFGIITLSSVRWSIYQPVSPFFDPSVWPSNII